MRLLGYSVKTLACHIGVCLYNYQYIYIVSMKKMNVVAKGAKNVILRDII
jgi:hypothetical protein